MKRALGLVLLLLWGSIAGLAVISLRGTDWQIVYALDDPYIHMAMAKNLALHGVWGVSSEGFTSSSSSVAWTALLALFFKAFGARDVIPFVLNVLLATVIVVVVWRMLSRQFPHLSAVRMVLVLTVFTFATPLPALIFVGQEHILHVLVAVIFVFTAADVVTGPRLPVRSRRFASLVALGVLLVLIRYEGLYPIVVTSGLLLLRRRIGEALSLAVAAGVPLALYAMISIGNGWWWAPNSVLMKGNLPDLGTWRGIINVLGYSAYSSLLSLPAVAFLVYSAIALLVWHAARDFWQRIPILLTMVVLIALMHLQFSQPRAFWMFRYQAHLVALGVLSVASGLFQLRAGGESPRLGFRTAVSTAAATVLLLISPLTERALRSTSIVPAATANIYEQQYQMGRFLREYYAGESVALNDIGAPSFLADVKVLDLVGLANIDVARLKRARLYSSATIDDLARYREVRMAIVYDRWFPGVLPSGWVRAGTWTIRNNVVVGSDTVTFYATSPRELPMLLAHLRQFERTLPPRVVSVVGK